MKFFQIIENIQITLVKYKNIPLKWIIAIPLLGLIIWWFAMGFFKVNVNQLGVKVRFGKVISHNIPPGLHYHLPPPIEKIYTPEVTTIRKMSVGFRIVDQIRGIRPTAEETQMLTGDTNIINVEIMLQYVLSDAAEYLFSTEAPHWLVRKASESVLTSILGQLSVDEVLTTARPEIQQRVMNDANQLLNSYKAGVRIISASLQKIDPPDEVLPSFKDVASAKADRERLINEAITMCNDILPKARGEASGIIQEANAYKKEVVERASGETDMFLSMLTQYKIEGQININRLYLEALEKILPKIKKYAVSPNTTKDSRLHIFIPSLEK